MVLGWTWSRTRRMSLAALVLTAVSWFGLGYWRGWGYCLCTDWHWQVRRSLGDLDLPHNYIGFLIREGTGWRFRIRFWNQSSSAPSWRPLPAASG